MGPGPGRSRKGRGDHLVNVASQNGRKNWVASGAGLPTIGSSTVSECGIKWVVQNHATVPTADSLQRWRSGEIQPADDLYPVVMPQNLSPQLGEFICAIGRCTTKTFAFLDTMPGRRKDGHMPWAAHIDTLMHPETNLLFLDIARVNEAVIAHEFGHAWVQYVDECEDLRTLEDASSPQRMRQVSHVQSFVLDLKVNDLIARKGFDMSPICNDQGRALFQLAELLSGGYQPGYPAEEVFMALTVADAMIQRDRGQGSELACFDNSLSTIEGTLAPMVDLADRFAASVRKHGYDSHASITACIDECLLASFEHCGDRFDLNAELVLLNPEEPDRDKFPEWLPLVAPRAKCSVGKYMARNDISSDWTQMIAPSITGRAKLSFVSPAAIQRFELPLGVQIGKPTRYSHLPEMEAELLAIKIRNRTGDLQLDGGPPHSVENCLFTPSRPPLAPGSPRHIPEPGTQNPALSLGAQRGPSFPGRPYMAGTARFLTAARLAEQLGGEHPYAYALDNPVTYTDPSGLKSCKEIFNECVDEAVDRRSACRKKFEDQLHRDLQHCLTLQGIARIGCNSAANAAYYAGMAYCEGKNRWRLDLCLAQYVECEHGRDIAVGLVCITIAAGVTYCIYRGCRIILAPETGPLAPVVAFGP